MVNVIFALLRWENLVHRRRQDEVLLLHWRAVAARGGRAVGRLGSPRWGKHTLLLLQRAEVLIAAHREDEERAHDDDMAVPAQAIPCGDGVASGEEDKGCRSVVENQRRKRDAQDVVDALGQRWRRVCGCRRRWHKEGAEVSASLAGSGCNESAHHEGQIVATGNSVLPRSKLNLR